MTNSIQKPIITLRDGSLKASLWRNQTEKCLQYSVQLAKTYTDKNGNPKDTTSFTQSDLLRIVHLASKAYDSIAEYREQDKFN